MAKVVYVYDWTWKWHAWRRLFDVEVSKLVTNAEKKIREKLLQQKGVTRVVSITTTTRKWHEYVALIYHSHVEGTTRTVFESSVKLSKSPVAPVIIAIVIVAVCAVIIALAMAYSITTVSSDVKEALKIPGVPEAVEAVAEAVPYVAVGGAIIVVALIGLYLWSKRKK